MNLGIDLGTSRTVVAASDRGNYPVVRFRTPAGDWCDWFPSLIGYTGSDYRFGFAAAPPPPGPAPCPKLWFSFKRELGHSAPDEPIREFPGTPTPLELVTRYCLALRDALENGSDLSSFSPKEVVISVPAGANSNQRFLTLEAFRRAGFPVSAVMHEPSAAGLEYTQRQILAQSRRSPREWLAVYDLGAGTFDSSVIAICGGDHAVLAAEGIDRLGGDDFDQILLELALEGCALPPPAGEKERSRLLQECQEAKERLNPHRKKVFLDFSDVYPGMDQVTVPVARFYRACQPLIERTVVALERAIETAAGNATESAALLAAIYLTGGSSDFPPIEWMIREKYGRRVRKSPYPHAATAIGLAVAADPATGLWVRDRLSRNFGVWREEEGGRRKVIDLIFTSATPIVAGSPPARVCRRYAPTHNIGHFRFQEFSSLGEGGQPAGNVSVWSEVFFPYDPALQNQTRFLATDVHPAPHLAGQWIEETYTCTPTGEIGVEIVNCSAGYGRSYSLRRGFSSLSGEPGKR